MRLLMQTAMNQLQLVARSYHRVLKEIFSGREGTRTPGFLCVSEELGDSNAFNQCNTSNNCDIEGNYAVKWCFVCNLYNISKAIPTPIPTPAHPTSGQLPADTRVSDHHV